MENLLDVFIEKDNNLFQSEAWQGYQEALGHKTFKINCNDCDVYVIKMPLYKDKNYFYCPRAPQTTKEGWHLFVNKLNILAKQENAVFVRVEPYKVPNGILGNLKFKRVGAYTPLSLQFSPMDTLLLDISKSEEDILNQMKPKWRYNIKLAERRGVTVRESQDMGDLEEFYKLSVGMEKRGYHAFDVIHYKKMLDALGKKNLSLFVAEHEGEILSVLLVTFYGKNATYLHGASSDNKRELMPNHLAQWKAILAAKDRGCEIYDFWGIAPNGEPEHEWAGITRFKLGFGGQEVHFLGAYDYVFEKIWYNLFYFYNFMRKLKEK